MQTPLASFIFFSASSVNDLALTIIGHSGRYPRPITEKYPYLVTSITGAFLASLAYKNYYLYSSGIRLHNLFTFIDYKFYTSL